VIEQIRASRGQRTPLRIGTTDYYWHQDPIYSARAILWDSIYGIVGVNPCTTNLVRMTEITTLPGGLASQVEGRFIRKAYVEDVCVKNSAGADTSVNNIKQKKFTVTVSWSDYSGSHKSNIVTILSRY
jgi:hypothetical protein